MRCPECTQRNSVAASVCKNCGHKFKKKPMAMPVKLAILGVVGVGTCWAVASALVPGMSDPSANLSRVAKRVAGGPKTPDDAKILVADFDKAARAFLTKNSKLPASVLAKKLQDTLNNSTFEVHEFELPRGLRVVEIDTILQAWDYLLVNSGDKAKVITVGDLEVFESGQLLVDNSAPSLVLIGHTGGSNSHRPRVKIFSILPDDAVDKTSTAIPEMKAEGTVAFAPNHKDLLSEQSLYSVGATEGVFRGVIDPSMKIEDETLKSKLTWKDGAYTIKVTPGKGKLEALYAVSKLLQIGAPADDSLKQFTTDSVKKTIADNKAWLSAKPDFNVTKMSSSAPKVKKHRRGRPTVSGGKYEYVLSNSKQSLDVDLEPASAGGDSYWVVTNIEPADQDTVIAAAAKEASDERHLETHTTTATLTSVIESSTRTDTQAAPSEKSNQQGTKSGAENSNKTNSQEKSTTDENSSKITEISAPRKVPAQIVEKTISQHSEPGTNTKAQIATIGKNGKPVKVETPPTVEAPPVVPDKLKTEPTTKPAKPEKTEKTEKTESTETKSETQTGNSAVGGSARTSSPVNLRSGPGGNYRAMTTIERGSRVEVIGSDKDWVKVRVGGREGYIFGSLLKYSNKTSDSSSHHGSSSNESAPKHGSAASTESPSGHHGSSSDRSSANRSSTSGSATNGSSAGESSSHKGSSSSRSESGGEERHSRHSGRHEERSSHHQASEPTPATSVKSSKHSNSGTSQSKKSHSTAPASDNSPPQFVP